VSIWAYLCLTYVNDDQAKLITAGFLHKHSYKRKKIAVVSVGAKIRRTFNFRLVHYGKKPFEHKVICDVVGHLQQQKFVV